jgi:hypothetical protein
MSDSDLTRCSAAGPIRARALLSAWRKARPLAADIDPIAGMAIEAATEKLEHAVYKAFGFIPAGTVNQSCEVRTWVDGTDVPDGVVFFYRLLMQIAFTSTTELRLMLPDTIIVLTGQNLEPLRLSLTRQHATYIQQFSKRVWRTPLEFGEAVIDKIEIIR